LASWLFVLKSPLSWGKYYGGYKERELLNKDFLGCGIIGKVQE